MVVRLQVNDDAPIPYSSYQIGRSTGLQCNLDISEILAFTPALSNEEASKMNAYLAQKWGLSDSLPSTHPLTYLSVGEIELFPPAQINTSDYGDAIELNGDKIELPFQIDQTARSSGFTAAIWTIPNSVDGVAGNPDILLSSKDEGYDWSLGFKTGNPFVRTGKLETTTPQIAYAGQKVHLVGVFDPTTSQSKIYLNGVPALLKPLGLSQSSSRLAIGADTDGMNPFNGRIDDLRIWNRPLNETEVELLFGSGLGDWGPQGSLIVTSPTYRNQVDATLTFNQPVNDFDASVDLSLSGVNWISTETEDNQTYHLSFSPTSYSSGTLLITLDENAVTDSLGSTNSMITKSIDYRPHRVAESDLLVWWKLDDDALDSSQYVNHGTTSNPDWNSSGKFGSSLSFDLSNGRSLTHTGLTADYPAVTLSAWVFPRHENFHIFQVESKGLSWTLEKSRPLFSFAGISQSYLPGENEDEIHARGYLPLHQWNHLAFSYDLNSRILRLYLNGELDIQSSFASSSPFPLTSEFRLGKADNLDFSSGEIDDFRIYQRILSTDEIKQIYGLGGGTSIITPLN